MHRVPLKSKAAAVCRRLARIHARQERRASGAAVLLYHGVIPRIEHQELEMYAVDRKTFAAHAKYLKKHLCPIPLTHLIETLGSGEPIDPRWVAVTLDDGLRNQTTLAAEILGNFEIPWSLTVPTGLIGTDRSIWTYELSFLMLKCWKSESIPLPGTATKVLPTETRRQKVAAYESIKRSLMTQASHRERLTHLDRLVEEFGKSEFYDRLHSYGQFSMANWGDLKRLLQNGVELVSHGRYHVPHHVKIEEREEYDEVSGSAEEFYEQLGMRPAGFAFPYGRHLDRSIEAVAKSGFDYALTSEACRVTLQSCRFRLPRINAEYPTIVLRQHMLSSRDQSTGDLPL